MLYSSDKLTGVLKKLPDYVPTGQDPPRVHSNISNSVIEVLKRYRGGDEKATPKQKKKRRVPPSHGERAFQPKTWKGRQTQSQSLEVQNVLCQEPELLLRSLVPIIGQRFGNEDKQEGSSPSEGVILDHTTVAEVTVLVNYTGSLFPEKVVSVGVSGGVRVCGKAEGWKWTSA